MYSSDNILSIDFGTSSLKLQVLTGELKPLQTAKVSYDLIIKNNDWVELNPEDLWKALRQGVEELGEYRDTISLIAYDTFSSSLTFMDAEGNALMHTITHLDRRAKEQTIAIQERMTKEYFQSITGTYPFTGGCPLTTVMWVKKYMPELFQKTYKFGNLNSYLYKRLTGLWAIDYCNATMMGLYETTTMNGWSKEICETFEIPMDILLDVQKAGTIAGGLTKEAANYLGLRAGIPVALGTNDAAISQVGAGNTNVGNILNVAGSSDIFSVLSDIPKPGPCYYLRAAATVGLWQIFSTSSAGFSIEWCRKEFFGEMAQEEYYNDEMAAAIANEPNGTGVRFLPYLSGDRQSLEPKTGGFTGLTLDSTRRDMLAAVMVGIHQHILDTVKACEQLMPNMGKEIKMSGGFVTDAVLEFKQRLLPGYKLIPKDNCTLLGNAILALENLT